MPPHRNSPIKSILWQFETNSSPSKFRAYLSLKSNSLVCAEWFTDGDGVTTGYLLFAMPRCLNIGEPWIPHGIFQPVTEDRMTVILSPFLDVLSSFGSINSYLSSRATHIHNANCSCKYHSIVRSLKHLSISFGDPTILDYFVPIADAHYHHSSPVQYFLPETQPE